MAHIRIRLTNKQRNAVRAEIKRLVDNNLIGTGPKYTAPSRVARLVYANRGLRGLPQLFGSGCVEYYVTQMLKDGDLIAKEDEDGECYLVTKENQNRDLTEGPIETKQENNMEKKEMTKIEVIDQNDKKADEKFARMVENKIQKSFRNTREFKNALNRALMGAYDEDIEDATGEPYLKVCERWTIRKIFSIETGEDYYKLYKEVYYIENPGKYYFEEVNPTIYRRIAPQHEEGDRKWAEAVSKHENIQIVED